MRRSRSGSRLQYLGYSGHDNLGDDVIKSALEERLPEATFLQVPMGRRDLLRHGSRHAVAARGAALLLGGGTLVGRSDWHDHVERAAHFFRPRAWEMLGIGVEDPDFVGSRAHTSNDDLRHWKSPLARFRSVTVRGPRSRELLAGIGVDAEVVGDPALLLQPDVPSPELVHRSIDVLVNATCGEDQWGGVDLDWTPRLVDALRTTGGTALNVEFVSMESTDDAWNQRIAKSLGIEPVIHRPRSHVEFFELAACTKVLLGTRLHSNILAAAAGTPNMSVEYRPKCRDYMDSVQCGRYCYRSNALDADQIAEDLGAILADWSGHRERLGRSVAVLRDRLEREMIRMVETFRPATGSPDGGA